MHGSDHVLPADGALSFMRLPHLVQVTMWPLQQNAVNGRVHADPTQVLTQAGPALLPWTQSREESRAAPDPTLPRGEGFSQN